MELLFATQQAGLGLMGWIILWLTFLFIVEQLKGKKKEDNESENHND